MDLNRAAIFVRVVDEGGFTAAGRALRLPKSSVSRSVALLEEELGARLLQRSTRKLRLTEAGSAFYERASRGLAGVQEAAAAVADLQGLLRGPIRITAPADAGVWLLAPLVARFVAEHPAVHIELVLTGRMVDLVAEGFDFALRAGALADSRLVARRLRASRAGPVRRARLPAAPGDAGRRWPIWPNHDCVMFRPDRGRARWTLTGPGRRADRWTCAGRSAPTTSRSCSGWSPPARASACCPGSCARRASAHGELVRVLPDYAWAAGDFHLVYPSARYLPQRAAAFRDFLLDELGEPQRTGLS